MLKLKINSPATVIEGKSYLVRLTATNQSTKAGIPTEAMLEVVIFAGTNTRAFIPPTANSEFFRPGEIRSFEYPMSIPLGASGEPGNIVASINDPTGKTIASASEDLIIEAVVGSIAISLKYPPPNVWYWQVSLATGTLEIEDWQEASRFIDLIPMDGIADFGIVPAYWVYPLSVSLSVIGWINGDADILFSINTQLPSVGDYYFNCNTKLFERR